MTELTYDSKRVNNLKYDLRIPLSLLAAKLTPVAFAVGIKMLLFANFSTGKLHVGQKRLAALANISKRSIPKAVNELVEAGIITFDRQGNGRDPAHYTVLSIVRKNDEEKENPRSLMIEGKEYTDTELVDLAYMQVERKSANTTEGLRRYFERCVRKGVMYDGELKRGKSTDSLRIEKIQLYQFPVNPLSLR